MELNLKRPLIVFDLETTGLDLVNDRIIQISYIKVFPDGKEDITGYQYEPWHIRYVGVDTAKEIDQLGVSLEEYLGVQSEYTGPWEH